LTVFGRNFCEKRQIWVSDLILGNLGVTHDLRGWLVGKPIVDTITVPELRWGEMCTVRLFSEGGRPLCTQILPGRSSPPSTTLGIRIL